MKKIVSILILLSFFSFSYGQKAMLRAYLSHASFFSPESGPYIETYLSILGKSVQFIKTDNGKFQGSIQVTMLFKQNDSIRQFLKYNLQTAVIEDTSKIDFLVFDQQRLAIPSGDYQLELQLADNNRTLPAFKAVEDLSVNYTPHNINFSDIELVDSYTQADEKSKMAKSGYDFIPYQDNFYPQSVNKIKFYSELYNTSDLLGSQAPFVTTASIQFFETGKAVDNYFRIKRETSNKVNVVFNEFDITDLPSGNYNLALSVRDKENKEIASKSMFFQRSNPGIKFNTEALQNVAVTNSFVSNMTQLDTLREYIRMCSPIASSNEKLFIQFNTDNSDLKTLQQFLLNFWTQRSPVDPESAWVQYYLTVLGVNQEFSCTNKKGYETDRGRVYLQYGPPNERIKELMNPDAYPYEIWQYYQIGNQSNQKFVFYTRDMALSDFVILHSTLIGEIKNVSWQYDIKRSQHDMRARDTDNSLYNSPYEEDDFGEHTGDNYNLRR